jgi:hypothetical protein
LADLNRYKSCGYETATFKVALLYMKEHYSLPKVRVEALTARDYHRRTGVEFWEQFGFAAVGVCQESVLGGPYQLMEAEITNALAHIANDGALGCVIDAGSYSKIIMTRYRGLELYFTSERHRWDDCDIKDVPGLGSVPSNSIMTKQGGY